MGADEARTGQAGHQGAMVVVKMMVGVRKGSVHAVLEAEQLWAAVEAPSTRILPLLLAGGPGLRLGCGGAAWLGFR